MQRQDRPDLESPGYGGRRDFLFRRRHASEAVFERGLLVRGVVFQVVGDEFVEVVF